MQSDAALQRALAGVVRPLGLTFEGLAQAASQIILFGSRAAGMARETSDWDLLCIGSGRPVRSRAADIVWVRPEILDTQRWLGCELASHVAAYGRWLRGPDDWRCRARISPAAIERKIAAVRIQSGELQRLWPCLLIPARERHARRLRREVQRVNLMRAGTAVPPARRLDELWAASPFPRADLEFIADAIRSFG